MPISRRLWKTILQTPRAQNPIGTDGCFRLGGILAPFGGANPKGAGPCTVKPGTEIFVAASSVECSTFEPPPFFGANEDELRTCARQDVTQMPIVTLDGKPLPVAEVETPLLNITLPEDNILGVPPGPGLQGQSVAHGWVALPHPLTPGEHTIVGKGAVVVPPGDGTFTTTIKVQPGFKP